MDPTAALIELISALADLDRCTTWDLQHPEQANEELTACLRVDVLERLTDLQSWLAKGGFPPNVYNALQEVCAE